MDFCMTYIYIPLYKTHAGTRLGESDKITSCEILENPVTISLYVHKFSSSLINCSLRGENEVRAMMI